MTRPRAFVTLLASLFGFLALPALACSVPSVEAWWEYGIYLSRWYWAATALLGLAVVYLAKRRSRAWFTVAVVALAAIFHPSWTVTPMWGPDCEHLNVFVSKLIIGLLMVMLAYQAFQLFWRRRSVHLAQ